MTLRLTARTLLLFVSSAAALVATVSTLAYRSGRASLEAAALSELQTVAMEKEAALDSWIEERLSGLRLLAGEADLGEKAAALVAAASTSRDARSARALVLQEIAPHQGAESRFLEVFVIDADTGTVLVSTSPAEEGKSKIGHPYFDRGKTGLYLQGPYLSVDVGAPVMTAAAPLRSADGPVLAVLAARLDLDVLNTIVGRRLELRQTEDAFVVNAERTALTQPRFLNEPAVLRRTIDTEAAGRCVAGNNGVLLDNDYRGVPAMIAYRWNAQRQMCLIVKVDHVEALAPVRAFGLFIIQLGGLALFVAAGLALLLARTITRPLRLLHESVKRFAEGRFEVPIPESSNDEIGLVAREFNRMVLVIGSKDAELRQLAADLEKKVQDRTAELARAQEVAQLGSWEWDVTGNIVTWSDEAFRLFGYAPGGCTPSYDQYLACLHPDDRPQIVRWINDVLEEKRPASSEFRVVWPNGEVHSLHNRADVVLDSSGHVARLIGTAQDITIRRRQEDRLRLFQALLTQSADSILVADPVTTRITEANDAACRALGYTRDELLTLTVSDIETTFSSPADFVHRLPQLLAGGTRAEGRQRRNDGSTFPVDVSVSHVVGPNGDHLLAISRDITVRKRDEEELQQAKGAAEASSRAKSEFLATMSHEIRTPMNGVIGAAGLLLEDDLTSRQRELATIVRSSADALLTLINDILDISRIEAGRMPIEQTPFDLLTTMEEVGQIFAWLVEEKQIELVLRYPPDARRLFVGDAGRIRQVLVNLVGNAIKFTKRGHVLVSVEEAPRVAPEPVVALRFTIEDTGIGIAPEALPRLFEHFAQADASTTRRFGGTGLGLAICKRLVELMGGEIGATSRVGEGATFWFTLPLLMDANAAPAQTSPPACALLVTRVLLVDDQMESRRVTAEQLSGWNIRHAAATTAREALVGLRDAVASGDPYHITLIDYRLPDMDGVRLAQMIKADPAVRDTALILLVSGLEENVAHLGRAGGFISWLVKPMRPSALFDRLNAACAARAGGLDARTGVRQAADAALPPARPRFRGHVLVADDSTTNQRVAQIALEGLGCSVDLARNGAEALTRLQQRRYDLVFMDCEMPEVDGFEATREIRASEARRGHGGSAPPHQHLPIVAMTAKVLSGDREKCLAAGMDDYLGKPVPLQALIETLERWLPLEARLGVSEPAAQTPARPERPDTPSGALDRTTIEKLTTLARATAPGLLAQVLEAFQTDAATYLAALKDAAARNDPVSLRRTAHVLKGASLNVGATTMADVSRQIEAVEETGGLVGTAVLPLLAQLEREFQRVHAEVEAELKGGAGG